MEMSEKMIMPKSGKFRKIDLIPEVLYFSGKWEWNKLALAACGYIFYPHAFALLGTNLFFLMFLI